MSDLLLELFSEEIPARMQARACADLERLVSEGLTKAGLTFEGARTYVTPRRLILTLEGLPQKSPATREERKGPRVGAPEKALEGFMRGAGLKSIDEAEIVSDPKKGDFYVAITEKPGRPAADILAELIPEIIRSFPWPKSMRWGEGKLRWVRPLHSILCLLDGKAVTFEVDGIESGNVTKGHRFLAPKPIKVKDFADYAQKLREAKVIIDPKERADIILKSARALAKDKKLKLVEDEALLAENAGLVEWPVVLMGDFDKAFLTVPPEVLTTAMKAHQKCFSVKKGAKLSNQFILVSNLEAEDGGEAITQGNERVIRARLSDAKFFWEQDKKFKLDALLPKLEEITFHEKLGTQAERVARIKQIARELAPIVGADPDKAERAAKLCKLDLVTEMVGEFPELQGLMGRYYAEAQGESEDVAKAIEDHYKPQGPTDEVPGEPTAIAVALADKLDTLVGFWAIDEKPTGSKDPYALRRAALGIIRIVLENKLRIRLEEWIRQDFVKQVHTIWRRGSLVGVIDDELSHFPLEYYDEDEGPTPAKEPDIELHTRFADFKEVEEQFRLTQRELDTNSPDIFNKVDFLVPLAIFCPTLLAFFADRLKVYLRDQGARHDLIDAVFSLGGQDDLLMIVKRVEALGNFLSTDDGATLLAGAKRAQNILRIEEKKDGRAYDGEADASLLQERHEKALHKAIAQVTEQVDFLIGNEDFEGAMQALAKLSAPVDDFFDHVTVNADDEKLRENRLKLLSQIRAATLHVADFSKVEG